MKKALLSGLALLLAVVMADCIATGTLVFVFDLEGSHSSPGDFEAIDVDLSTNKDYNDHKDKIKSIDAVAVVGQISNNTSSDVAAEIYISDEVYTDPQAVRDNATIVFISPTIPANDTIFVDWSDGLSHIENFDELKAQIEDGSFKLYVISSGPLDLHYDLNLIVTMTAGA